MLTGNFLLLIQWLVCFWFASDSRAILGAASISFAPACVAVDFVWWLWLTPRVYCRTFVINFFCFVFNFFNLEIFIWNFDFDWLFEWNNVRIWVEKIVDDLSFQPILVAIVVHIFNLYNRFGTALACASPLPGCGAFASVARLKRKNTWFYILVHEISLLTIILTAPGAQGSSAAARFVRSSGGHAIAVHLAKVPDVSQLQVLQSALKTFPGVHVKPGSFTPGFASCPPRSNEFVDCVVV